MANYIHRLIALFTASKHSEELVKEFQRWLVSDEKANEKEVAIRQIWDETEAEADDTTLQSLNNVYKKIFNEGYKGLKQHSRVHTVKAWWRMVAAAIVIALISVATTLHFSQGTEKEVAMIEISTSPDEMRTIVLPDSSVVQLNYGSLLLYPERFIGNNRTVHLIGEANFKVAKNPEKPFIVKSNKMAVTALGTEFDVSAYPESYTIISTLIQGKIRVDCAGEESYTLKPGQQVTYRKDTGQSQLSDVDIEEATSWQRGVNVFRGKTIVEILDALEHRFNINFQYDTNEINGDKYNFTFHQNSTLDEVLEVMKEVAQDFDYEVKNGECYINFK